MVFAVFLCALAGLIRRFWERGRWLVHIFDTPAHMKSIVSILNHLNGDVDLTRLEALGYYLGESRA